MAAGFEPDHRMHTAPRQILYGDIPAIPVTRDEPTRAEGAAMARMFASSRREDASGWAGRL
jgi:hypothetical protein